MNSIVGEKNSMFCREGKKKREKLKSSDAQCLGITKWYAWKSVLNQVGINKGIQDPVGSIMRVDKELDDDLRSEINLVLCLCMCHNICYMCILRENLKKKERK